MDLQQFRDRRTIYRRNKENAYELIWGQCTDAIKDKIKASNDYAVLKRKRDPIQLLFHVRKLIFNFKAERYPYASMHKAVTRFGSYRQGKAPCLEYQERFLDNLKLIEDTGGKIGPNCNPGTNDDFSLKTELEEFLVDPATATDSKKKAAFLRMYNKYIACCFLLQADKKRFGKLIEEYENASIQNKDLWPKTFEGAYTRLINFKFNPKNHTNGYNNIGGATYINANQTRNTRYWDNKQKKWISKNDDSQKQKDTGNDLGNKSKKVAAAKKASILKKSTGTQMLNFTPSELEPTPVQEYSSNEYTPNFTFVTWRDNIVNKNNEKNKIK